MKRVSLIIIVITFLWLVTSSKDVMAATGLSEGERTILDKMESQVSFIDRKVSIPAPYINQVENELIKNKTDITSEQAAFILNKLDEALTIAENVALDDIMAMRNTEVLFQLLQLMDEALSEINYKLTINLEDPGINITNPEGESVMITKSGINQTGISIKPAVIGVSSFVIMLIGSISFAVYLLISSDRKREICKTEEKGLRI